MTRALARMAAKVWQMVGAMLLLGLLCLTPPALAAGAAPKPTPGADQERPAVVEREGGGAGDGEPRATGPRNPYDMKALQEFDAGSHRAEEPS